MIFTNEQLKRLPGSKVLCACGAVVTVGEKIKDNDLYVTFNCEDGGLAVNAVTHKSMVNRSFDNIAQVMEWADERNEQ